LQSTGTYNKTDHDNSYLFNNGMKLGIKKKKISLNSTNSWIYGMQQKRLTNNDFVSTLDFDLYKLAPHAYYWGLANYTSNFSLKINNQLQLGGGLAYNVIDRKRFQFNISDGIIWENSDIFLNDTVRDIYSTWRNSFRLQLKYSAGILSVNGTSFIQNSLEFKNDYIFKADLELDIKILRWLSLAAGYTYNHFTRTNKENTLFTYGITIEKYFSLFLIIHAGLL
jgi:Protein of unknown function, DUF481